jgi:lipopolysaccharide heptosyltransferase II
MNSQAATRNPQAARILIRGTNWLGDAVMTTPALLRLRERFPDAHITLLTPEKLQDLWANHPAVNEVISFMPDESIFRIAKQIRRWSERPREPHLTGRNVSSARGDTRPAGFDLALVLPNSPRSAIETWLARIPLRVGYARPWRNFFLTQTVPPRAEAVKMQKRSVNEIRQLVAHPIQNSKLKTQHFANHQIHEYLHLAVALGANSEPLAPQLFVSPDEIEATKKKFRLENDTRPVFGLNPGAEYGPAKRWPAERFIAVAKEIHQRTNCLWILFGGKGDLEITNQVASALPSANSHLLNLAGKTSLRELMALLKMCRVLLTNDSGPMHVAAALGTPVVVPFGSTSPELTGPGLPGDSRHRLLKSSVACSPCFLRECPIDFRCMNGISVERVIEAVMSAHC